MFLTLLIESHAARSPCMQMRAVLSSISGGRVGGVLVYELSDRFLLNALTAMLSAMAAPHAHVSPLTHSDLSAY